MKAVKSVQAIYETSEDLASILEDFRLMCNDALRIALTEKPRNRFRLIELSYLRLKEYGLHSHYILSACEVAFAAYRNKKRKCAPYVRKAFLKLDSQSYSLSHLILRIPTRPRHFVYMTLRGSDYHLSIIDDPAFKRGSVTVTDLTLTIAFTREAPEIETLGKLGIDVNERNVTVSDTLGSTSVHDTSKVAELKERYRAIRAKIGERTGKDSRVSQRLYRKYGTREKSRSVQTIHGISKQIVQRAKENRLRIVMENLRGIRKLYRKGNGQGRSFRGRMNSWTFREVQRQVEYKARWEGIPVTYVSPRGTSRKCPDCDSSLLPLEGRRLLCPSCNKTEDRDAIASRNIMMAAPVRAARPPGGSSEGEPRRQEKAGNPPSRRVEVDFLGCEPKS